MSIDSLEIISQSNGSKQVSGATTVERPTKLMEQLQPNTIPLTLRELKQWVVWRYELVTDHWTKVPFNPSNGKQAKSTDVDTWTTFDAALLAITKGGNTDRYDGIGFVFTDGIVGIDLDKCRDLQTGNLEQWALDIVQSLNSYTEVSPSGRGVHIFANGALLWKGRKRGDTELYDSLRFFTVTGEHVSGTPTTIEERQQEIESLHAKVWPEHHRPNSADRSIRQTALPASGIPDSEVIARACRSKNGKKIGQLLEGNFHEYTSQSEAELALSRLLAPYTQNMEQIKRIIATSGLRRDKWLERDDYADKTVGKAINSFIERSSTLLSPPHTHITRFEIEIPTENGNKTTKAPYNPGFYPSTEYGNAQRLIARHGHRIKRSGGNWYIWSGKRWEEDNRDQILELAKETVISIYHEALLIEDDDDRRSLTMWAKYSERLRSMEAMIKLASSDFRATLDPADFDKNPLLLNVQNGTLNLESGLLYPHRPEDLITRITAAPFDPDLKSALWERFLFETTKGDDELIRFLQRAIGYSLSGKTSEEVLFVLHGPEASGKSTLVESVKRTLGSYATVASFETFLAQPNPSGVRPDLARLRGARFVGSSEADEGRRLSPGFLKAITGGDTVLARLLYKDSFEFVPEFKLWWSTNYMPNINSADGSMWRRIVRIPMDHTVIEEKRDPTLKESLCDPKHSGAAILAWAIAGYGDYAAHRLNVPKHVQESTRRFREESDPVSEWINERCEKDLTAETEFAKLFSDYRNWAIKNADENALAVGKGTFGTRLAQLGHIHARGNEGKATRIGIKLS